MPESQPLSQPVSQPVEERFRRELLETVNRQYDAGIKEYGVPVMTNNGLNYGQYAREELVDAGRYVTALEMENEQLQAKVEELEKWLKERTGYGYEGMKAIKVAMENVVIHPNAPTQPIDSTL